MSILLAIDTTTEACSVALCQEGQIDESFALIPRQHADRVLGMLRHLLDKHGLELNAVDAIAFGRGPGSFTGLRIAAGVTQGLAFGLDVPVLPISTLAALAHEAWRQWGEGTVLSAIDARIGEVYWACYRCSSANGLEALSEEVLCAPADMACPAVLKASGGLDFAMGNGWQLQADMPPWAQQQARHADAEALPRAAAIAALGWRAFQAGEGLPAEAAAPIYLRDKVTQ